VLAEHGPWAAVIAFGTGGILEIVLFIRCHRALLGPPAASPAHTGPG
jgi:hypothetical protein